MALIASSVAFSVSHIVMFSIFAVFLLYNLYSFFVGNLVAVSQNSSSSTGQYPTAETLRSRILTEKQCRATFPGLLKEVDDAVARGSFVQDKFNPDSTSGPLRGRIKDGKLYILFAERDNDMSQDALRYRFGVLNQLYRAIITSPTPLPSTTFSLTVSDNPRSGSWSFSRPARSLSNNSPTPDPPTNHWVMPHFSFWTWPNTHVGPFDTVLVKIEKIEAVTRWADKIDKAVWRGTVWYSPIGNKDLRKTLVKEYKGKEWADIEASRGDEKNATTGEITKGNGLSIEDFCKYKYVIYTDGVTYSGRLAFHQACASVLLTPPPTYLQPTTHLLRPLFSPTLDTNPTHPEWRAYTAQEANAIFLRPDWSDLEDTIMWLRENPAIAEGIARRGREVVTKRGYFSEAAEACYWRGLVTGWSTVAKSGEGEDEVEGVRWEEWSTKKAANRVGRGPM